jgi:serine/threonine-protein kinase
VRRRRRRVVGLVAVLLLGALSVGAGLLGVRLWREWNTHVPKLAGQSVSAAEYSLHRTGYAVNVSITHVFSETVPAGKVVRTDPAGGARVAQGHSIGLVVSLGKDRITMPDVTDVSLAQAETTLHSRGIDYDPTPSVASSVRVARGLVIQTDPAGNSRMKRSTIVHFTVSKGPPSVVVPNVENGVPYAKAAATLTKEHFVPTRIDVYNDTVPAGGVIAIDLAGEPRPYGSTIAVRVSKGPEFVTIPDFHILEPLSELQPQLEHLGLHVDVVTAYGGHAGRVLDVEPGSGTQVRPGETVKVTVV